MALEWLKTILGGSYTEEIDKKISEGIGKGFVSRADFNAVNEAKKTLEAQLSDRDQQLETLKQVDATKLQEEIKKLQGENTAAKQGYEAELAKLRTENALEVALLGAKARDVKAVKPFLNMDLIKLDGEDLLGFEEQIKKVKETKGYLFEDGTKPTKTGMSHEGSSEGLMDKKEEANAALRELFGKE